MTPQTARTQRRAECVMLALGLSGLAAFLWLRDLSWAGPNPQAAASVDVLPALAAFPVFVWLGGPWRLRAVPLPYSRRLVAAGAVLLLAGVGFDSTLLLAVGWTLLFYAALSAHLNHAVLLRVQRLMPLLVLAFPWLALDGQGIGWWMRLSASWAAEVFFAFLGLEVQRQGVLLFVKNLSISIDAPCSGMNTLQSLMLAGVALWATTTAATVANRAANQNANAAQSLRPLFFVLPLIVGAAWLINVLRIFALCGAALVWGVPFARGAFHSVEGWALLVLFGVGVVACQKRPAGKGTQWAA